MSDKPVEWTFDSDNQLWRHEGWYLEEMPNGFVLTHEDNSEKPIIVISPRQVTRGVNTREPGTLYYRACQAALSFYAYQDSLIADPAEELVNTLKSIDWDEIERYSRPYSLGVKQVNDAVARYEERQRQE